MPPRPSKKKRICKFCKTNGEPSSVFKSHPCHDEDGRVVCPILYKYVCPFCKATGDWAHTSSYCPIAVHGRQVKPDEFKYQNCALLRRVRDNDGEH